MGRAVSHRIVNHPAVQRTDDHVATEVLGLHGDRTSRSSLRDWELVDKLLAGFGWILFVGFLVLTVLPGLIGGKTFLATDYLSTYYPWADTAQQQSPVNVGLGDTFDSVAPTSILITSSARNGSFAEWDPYNSGGTEAGALPNSALLSPLSLPWWILDGSRAPAGVKLLELSAVALGMHLLLRRQWSLPRSVVPLAALLFGSSGFMIAWTNWPQTRVAAMIPLLFWAVDRLAVELRWRNSILFGAVLASMLLGGFPAVTLLSFYSAVVYFFVRSASLNRSVRSTMIGFLQSTIGGVIAVGLSAVQMLPFVWFATHYVDFEGRNGSNGTHLPLSTLATSIVPYLLGFPDNVASSWPVHFVEGFSYLGVAAVTLIVVAVLLRTRIVLPKGVLSYFVVGYLVWIVAIYFGGPLLHVIQLFPGVGTSLIGRARSLLGFFAAVLAALGAAKLFSPRPPNLRIESLRVVTPRLVAVEAARMLVVAAVLVPIAISVREGYAGASNILFAQKWVLVAALSAVAVVMGCLMAWILPSRRAYAVMLSMALLVTAATGTDVAHRWWPLSDDSTFYPETSSHAYLSEHIGQDRYIAIGSMMSGTSSAYRLRSVTGHAFTTPQWQNLLNKLDPDIFLTPTYSQLSSASILTSAQASILDRLGTRYYVLGPSLDLPGLVEASQPVDGEVELSSATPAASSATFTGPVRAVKLELLKQSGLAENATRLKADVVASDGSIIATTVTKVSSLGADFSVALDADTIPAGKSWHLELLVLDPGVTLTLGTTDPGRLSTALVRPADDGLSVVHTGDSTILENTRSLERIRWAAKQEVLTDETKRLDAMADPSTGSDTVILENSSDAADAVDTSSQATVSAEDVNTNTISISVGSSGPGWVVIADAMRGNGWSATIDGKPTEMVDAEEAGVAIHVSDSGSHTIVLRYNAPYFRAGGWVTLATVSGILLLGVGSIVRSTRKQRGSAHGDSGSHGRS